ncbi:HNH endonuclease [Pseudoalteromonas sp. S4492]|uniref:PIN domain-containing protein n=1 Tax=Pseudoalteromonas sp. S4492 TaxID=579560 RepID=UPI00110B9C60|nr:PIN domain-containing protein [Pseudoalteromonas sp. S4492]TMO24570.1 HNH endonuclease [Pseudoalteromonas sp. S4492]
MSLIFNKREIYTSPKEAFKFSLKSVDDLKTDCLFVLDANVLLLPFTTDGKSVEEIKRIYTTLVNEDRLYIPSQAAREYLDNRSTKLTDLYKLISDKSSQNFKYVCPHPLLSGMDEYAELEQLEDNLKEALKSYRNKLQQTLMSVKNWGWNDPVSKMYHEVLDGRILDDDHIDVQIVEDDLKRRNDHKIPPGYKDGSKEANQAGDLLIWHEILYLAKQQNKDVIFVSGDAKSDWFHKSDKKAIYPRFELVDEFREETQGKTFHIMSLSQVLSIFEASDEVVSDVESSEEKAAIKDTPEAKQEKVIEGHDVTSQYSELLGTPNDHLLLQTSSTWKQKQGLDTDTYMVSELDSYGKIVAKYEIYDSTEMRPPFSREVTYRKFANKI